MPRPSAELSSDEISSTPNGPAREDDNLSLTGAEKLGNLAETTLLVNAEVQTPPSSVCPWSLRFKWDHIPHRIEKMATVPWTQLVDAIFTQRQPG